MYLPYLKYSSLGQVLENLGTLPGEECRTPEGEVVHRISSTSSPSSHDGSSRRTTSHETTEDDEWFVANVEEYQLEVKHVVLPNSATSFDQPRRSDGVSEYWEKPVLSVGLPGTF